MNQPWTIVITTRNRAAMLERALCSAVCQTVPCEVIVVDDGSTDNTSQVVEHFRNVRYLRNEKALGHSAAANLGIREATGEWIKPLDDDDWLELFCLESFSSALAAASKFSPVFIAGRARNVDQSLTTISETPSICHRRAALSSRKLLQLMLWDRAFIGTPVQVGHLRQAALEAGGWDEKHPFDGKFGDDSAFWIRLAKIGGAVFVPDFVGYRRRWRGSFYQKLSPSERYQANLLLKERIAEALDQPLPAAMKSYLALHWALLAAKEKNVPSALQLGLRWAARPWSLFYLLRSRRLSMDARELETF